MSPSNLYNEEAVDEHIPSFNTAIYGSYYITDSSLSHNSDDDILLEYFKTVDQDNGFELLLNFPIYKTISAENKQKILDKKFHILINNVELKQTLYNLESGNYEKLDVPIYNDLDRYEIKEMEG